MKSNSSVYQCHLEAIYGIRREVVGTTVHMIAENSDPQIELQSSPGVPLSLRNGLYEIVFTGSCVSGSLSAPCVYIDYGDGFTEGEGRHLYLTWKGDNFWAGTIQLLGRAKRIRFDPSVDVFESSNLSVTVTRMRGTRPMIYSLARTGFRALVPGSIRRKMTAAGVTQRIAGRLMDPSSGSATPSMFTPAGGAQVPMGLYEDYSARVFTAKGGRHAQYGAVAAQTATNNTAAFKPIAYYLPQMHPFPENDAWWGKGFTEWTNVSKAVAQFRGHYQPKLPGELGFYDLRVPETMARQIELAKLYGLHGFCYYYYWFGGKRLLEKPVNMFLERKDDPAFDMPFCLCWANENWTRRWDGAEHEVLMAQTHSAEDHAAVFEDLLTYFKDRRYITVEGKPVILIYRPMIIPDLDEMLKIWQARAREAGLPGVYVVATNSFGFSEPEEHGFDALCGFPPHGLEVNPINYKLEKINSNYDGWVFEYAEAVAVETGKLAQFPTPKGKKRDKGGTFFPGLMVAWDNEARKPEKGNVFHDSTPLLYRQWLSAAAEATMRINKPDRRFVFINAWNEWAEGAYLEPDRRFGYGYLAATADVVREASATKSAIADLAKRTNTAARKTDGAVCLHIFYPEMIDEFASQLKAARRKLPLDLILTVPDTWSLADAKLAVSKLKPTRLLPCANRGRDVFPFLAALKEGLAMGYSFGCKLHSKKSPQMVEGDEWRHRLVDGLLGKKALAAVQADFISDEKVAIAAPAAEFVGMTGALVMQDNMKQSRDLLGTLGHATAQMDEFVAGTMFWFRFAALEPMALLGYTEAHFGPELGQLDGTLAHAFERVFVSYVKAAGASVLRY